MNKTINVSLPQGLLDSAKQKVKAGHYSSVSEVIRDALRQLPTINEPIKLSPKAQQQFDQAIQEFQSGKTLKLHHVDDLDTL